MKKILVFQWIFITAFLQQTIAQTAPHSTAGNIVSNASTVSLPITATGFTNIGSCNLELYYDPAIATVTSVTASPLLAGGASGLDYYVPTPGTIRFGWYKVPAVTVPDNSVIFNINFQKVSDGLTSITWSTDEYSCIWFDANYNALADTPQSNFYIPGSLLFISAAPQTHLPAVTACAGTQVSVPVSVTAFNHIGSLALSMNYDPSVLAFQSVAVNPSLPGLTVNGGTSGSITAGGQVSSSVTGLSLPDNTILFTMTFNYLGGITGLNWFDNGSSCNYTGPQPGLVSLNDIPQSSFYINGSVGPGDSAVCLKSVNVQLFLQGLYQGNGMMRQANNENTSNFGPGVADKVTVELHDAINYATIHYSASNIDLGTNGTIHLSVPSTYNGAYYLTIRQRNSIAVVSNGPVSFGASTISYNFKDQASKAFGNNMIQLGDGNWGLFSGDVNQDGIVDASDLIAVDNQSTQFATGYLPEDANGDGVIDSSDMIIIDNNSSTFVAEITP